MRGDPVLEAVETSASSSSPQRNSEFGGDKRHLRVVGEFTWLPRAGAAAAHVCCDTTRRRRESPGERARAAEFERCAESVTYSRSYDRSGDPMFSLHGVLV